jgi:glutaredoxin
MYLLFSIPNCVKCNNNKKILHEKNIEFKEVNVMESEENKKLAMQYNIKMGGTIIDDTTGKIIDVDEL